MGTLLLPLTLLLTMLCSPSCLSHPFSNSRGRTFIVSSSIGNAMGAVESRVVGPDGVTEGECSFTQDGQSVKVKYREEANGTIHAHSNNVSDSDALLLLKKCRHQEEDIESTVDEVLEKNFDSFKNVGANQDKTFKKALRSFGKTGHNRRNHNKDEIIREHSRTREFEDFEKRLEEFTNQDKTFKKALRSFGNTGHNRRNHNMDEIIRPHSRSRDFKDFEKRLEEFTPSDGKKDGVNVKNNHNMNENKKGPSRKFEDFEKKLDDFTFTPFDVQEHINMMEEQMGKYLKEMVSDYGFDDDFNDYDMIPVF